MDVLSDNGALHLLPGLAEEHQGALLAPLPAGSWKLVEACFDLFVGRKLQKAAEQQAPVVRWAAQIVRRFLLSGMQPSSAYARHNLQCLQPDVGALLAALALGLKGCLNVTFTDFRL